MKSEREKVPSRLPDLSLLGGALLACQAMEHRNVWLDPIFIDKPSQHLRTAIAGVPDKSRKIETGLGHHAFDHVAGSFVLSLTNGSCRFHIHDDPVVEIDQIVG